MQTLLATWPTTHKLAAIFDERARERLSVPVTCNVIYWAKPKVSSRLNAERILHFFLRRDDTVLCFHGLPLILPSAGRVIVFQQNRLYFGKLALRQFSFRTSIRLAIERLISRLFRHRVSEYIVQTPSMARDLLHWYGNDNNLKPPTIRISPFMAPLFMQPHEQNAIPEWDFVYVANGEAHKNHLRLLEAWRELAILNIRPRLALTLNACDGGLRKTVNALREECGAEVHDLGQMPHDQVLALYRRSRALIYPSLEESFGLPLIEAQHMGLPIIAAELDYVRDVCEPVQTFDPQSSHSIANAVLRFLGKTTPTVKIKTPNAFWAELLEEPFVQPQIFMQSHSKSRRS